MDVIKFYSVSDEYGAFSNFSAYPIKLKGKVWPTSEHYFQAMKFLSAEDQEQIRKAKSPMLAARMGRDRKKKIRKNWDSVKNSVMKEALLAKFSQHDDLKNLLISTRPAKLVEHTSNDSYWGDGGGRGKNMLGQILMEVRETLFTCAD
ncbi:swarming motility protein YbiA [Hahella sp. CCB-MM4]|uniref:NADAR family protein n=1 Tax=Hahella sp. (strain CCB-MM4) TaxID=1926491 RepID=UPI000B9B6F24|nr:NADAR family protein [Hahella sp. CCB-MM4]OZG74065.1 swarming motility protein YbiA [Hahella sp. CCB-MM4]